MPPAGPVPVSPAAFEVARRLVSRDLLEDADEAAQLAAVERACLRVPERLSAWFGAYGSRALLVRALYRAQQDHPALAGLTVADDPALCVAGLPESAAAHGANATSEGIIAVLAALTDQLGRLVGSDLVAGLLEQSDGAGTEALPRDENEPTAPFNSTDSHPEASPASGQAAADGGIHRNVINT